MFKRLGTALFAAVVAVSALVPATAACIPKAKYKHQTDAIAARRLLEFTGRFLPAGYFEEIYQPGHKADPDVAG